MPTLTRQDYAQHVTWGPRVPARLKEIFNDVANQVPGLGGKLGSVRVDRGLGDVFEKVTINPYGRADIAINPIGAREAARKFHMEEVSPATRTVEGAFVHELGHLIHDNANAWWKEAGIEQPMPFAKKWARENISAYAGESYQEAFAEAFAMIYADGGKWMKLARPEVRGVLQKLKAAIERRP